MENFIKGSNKIHKLTWIKRILLAKKPIKSATNWCNKNGVNPELYVVAIVKDGENLHLFGQNGEVSL